MFFIRALIDTIFHPVIAWLTQIYKSIHDLSVPLARPLNIDNYLGPIAILGNGWIDFVKTVCALAFIYCVTYVISTQMGFFQRFKDFVKWW